MILGLDATQIDAIKKLKQMKSWGKIEKLLNAICEAQQEEQRRIAWEAFLRFARAMTAGDDEDRYKFYEFLRHRRELLIVVEMIFEQNRQEALYKQWRREMHELQKQMEEAAHKHNIDALQPQSDQMADSTGSQIDDGNDDDPYGYGYSNSPS